MLTLEEADLAKKATHNSSSLLVARDSNVSHDISDHSSSNRNANGGKRNKKHNNNEEKHHNNNGLRGGGKGGTCSRGKAGGGGHMGSSKNCDDEQQPAGQHPPINAPWSGAQLWPWMAPWAIPSCPYPSNSWAKPNYRQQQKPHPGILGPKPQKAYTAAPTPSNIEAAIHTLGITSPDANWYIYNVSTSHMTSAQGFLDMEASNEV
ncbi:uncharacterized protein LOC107024821 [Solanum pennellii]|uniref:Uncharacterized protein LOC107024821 n=1 Tax=Solanum pennellii TaxID=28526 RepID=A0ABM1VDZ0_SOLPN|nr:uncharacterized protein LOC107024821 [Solanum pennellii]